MHPLNLTKVAFGCDDIEVLRVRHAARAVAGRSWISTRYRPTRHTELVEGSLFWIIKHQLVARQRVLGFEEEEGGRWRILLDADVVAVRPRAKRAHQGWRYLKSSDAPSDLEAGDADLAAMPTRLAGALAALGLL